MGKILNSLHDVPMGGKVNFAAAVQIAQLALKHRRNKLGGQRLVLFVASPVEEESKALVKVLSRRYCSQGAPS
jgi:26S proteasome regulatory subunit N10